CLWGQLVYDARSFTRQVLSFIDDETETGRHTQQSMIHLTIAFTHALRHRLRKTSPWEDVERFVEPEHHISMRQAGNLPEYLLRLMGKKLGYS
ncbi:bestrophin family ion channel, partial [Shewanella sp. T24-MNA-CIBAN-0130]